MKQKCHSCGGRVKAVARPGRHVMYRNVRCSIPASFFIRTCVKCGAEWMSEWEIDELSEVLEEQRIAVQGK